MTTLHGTLLRLTAFSADPAGGNPAGVWIGPALPDAPSMQRIASEVGYSETAFVAPAAGPARTVRYFSPEREIPFCGHATVATGVALGDTEGNGVYVFDTPVGRVPVHVTDAPGGRRAALTSVEPRTERVQPELLAESLRLLGWTHGELDPALPPVLAYAGAWHLVIAVARRERLGALRYDFEVLRTLMLEQDLTTLQLVWREREDLFHARNPFPIGGVVEDPATGAAAAALGGYLRSLDEAAPRETTPRRFRVRQGEDMGRPSDIFVEVPARGGIVVSGTAVRL